MTKPKTSDARQTGSKVRRNYKDGLFKLLFSDQRGAMELYNALSGATYTDPELFSITTIENVLYMGIKNDVSFLIEVENELDLLEAQSSWCPNMPLRGLMYFSSLYQGYISRRGIDIYSRKQILLPRPVYMVFYNGTEKRAERETLRLSDSFADRGGETALEVVAQVWNINYGYNKKLMENCRRLHDYAYLIDQIRLRQREGDELSRAVDGAVQYCIEKGVLREFLLEHRGEVRNVLLEEYNSELHIRSEKELSFAEGMEKGLAAGIEAFILDNLEEGIPAARILLKLQKRFLLTEEAAREYMEKFTGISSL